MNNSFAISSGTNETEEEPLKCQGTKSEGEKQRVMLREVSFKWPAIFLAFKFIMTLDPNLPSRNPSSSGKVATNKEQNPFTFFYTHSRTILLPWYVQI